MTRSNFNCLTDHGAAADMQNLREASGRKIRETWNRFQLVERAARVAQTTTANHGNHQAASGCERRQNERRLVANSAGRVLSIFAAENFGEVLYFSRMSMASVRVLFPRGSNLKGKRP